MSDLKNLLKNLPGKKYKSRYVLFLIDDYGNLRISGKEALNRLQKGGLQLSSRFDTLDALETCDDFDALFEILRCYRDAEGKHPVLTTYNLVANMNFEASVKAQEYIPESLSETYKRIHGDLKIRDYWRQGIDEELLSPEFHGREHLNVQAVNELFAADDTFLKLNIDNQSFAGIRPYGKSRIHPYASYDTNANSSVDDLIEITLDGLVRFEQEFGLQARAFAAPRGSDNVRLEECLSTHGIQMIDRQLIQDGGAGKKLYYTGRKTKSGLTSYVRNCRFEPGMRKSGEEVKHTLDQIDACFTMRNIAIVSSHRANFSGGIDEENRKQGLQDLNELLSAILSTWPDVRFLDLKGLGNILK